MGSASLDTIVSKTKLKIQALRRRQSKVGGQDALNFFLRAPFSSTFGPSSSGQSPASQPLGLQPASQPSVPQPASQPSGLQPVSQPSGPQPASLPSGPQPASQPSGLLSLSSQPFMSPGVSADTTVISAELKRRNCELRLKLDELKQSQELSALLQELCKEKEKTIGDLRKQTEKVHALKMAVGNLTKQFQDCKDSLKRNVKENRFLKHSAVYARLVRRDRELRNARELLRQVPQQEARHDKVKLRSLQKQISVTKKRLRESVALNKKIKKQLKEAHHQLQQNAQLIQATETQTPVLKEGQKFTDNVVTCTAQLVGECDIAAHSCRQVIQCVAQHIFKCDIPDGELPSKSSALRFADVGHVIAKMHAREEMTTKAFDLHCDGTSRSREKFVGQQITLADNTTLSLGFQLTAREDAQSLLDLTLHILDELHYLDFDARGEEQLKDMLRNMVGIMTDRANVMKSFQDAVETKKKEILQSEEGITRLYCNAHFLLGLSAAASKALTSVEKARDFQKKLGRDSLSAFKRFSSVEPAAVRLIRLVCDVLGPRGDEKNGCRDDWIAFCSLRALTSKLNSFRGNRFNNLFESAAAIIHHQDDICLFFSTYKEPSNLKQQSIVHDFQSTEIVAMVASLAVCFIFVTGPFWQLIKSSTHYLDQGIYIQHMFTNILAAKDCTSTPEMLTKCPTALQGFGLLPSEAIDNVSVYFI